MSTYRVFSKDEIVNAAPSIATLSHVSTVSDEYRQYSTLPLIEMLLEEGWEAVSARETRVRVKKYRGFQKHLIRFVHPNLEVGDDELMSIVLINSHDGRCSYRLYAGIFRLVCLNGAIVGWGKYMVKLSHRWQSKDEILSLSHQVSDSAVELSQSVSVLKRRVLTMPEKIDFAKSALQVLYTRPEDKERRTHITEILEARRDEDKNDSAWTVMNVVQENGMRGYSYEASSQKVRKITSITREVQFNMKVTKLAWEMFGNTTHS